MCTREKFNYNHIKGISKILPIAEKIMTKYTGNLENGAAKMLIDGVKEGFGVIVKLEPKYFAILDHSDAFGCFPKNHKMMIDVFQSSPFQKIILHIKNFNAMSFQVL